MIEELGHAGADEERIHGGPCMGEVTEHAELSGQRMLMVGDVGIHAARVDLKIAASSRCQCADSMLCDLAKSKDALLLVDLQHRRTHHGGEFTGGIAACHVHLPQTVLCGDVAL